MALIPKIISNVQNQKLNEKFSLEKVTQALNQLPFGKAPRPDEFPTDFFKKCWHILGQDLIEALRQLAQKNQQYVYSPYSKKRESF